MQWHSVCGFPHPRLRVRASATLAHRRSGARFDGRTGPTCFTNPLAGYGWGIGDRRSAGGVRQSKQPKGSSASRVPLPACGRRGGCVRLAALRRRWNGCGPLSGGGGLLAACFRSVHFGNRQLRIDYAFFACQPSTNVGNTSSRGRCAIGEPAFGSVYGPLR